jgi:hypothetical protein
LVEVPIEEEPEPAAFAFFAWRFSFSDLLAAVLELFEPPLSLLAMVAPFDKERPRVLNVPLRNPTKKEHHQDLLENMADFMGFMAG